MTMPDRIRDSVQAAVDQPVDTDDLLQRVRSGTGRRSWTAPLATAAAVALLAGGAGVVLQERSRPTGPATPGPRVTAPPMPAVLTYTVQPSVKTVLNSRLEQQRAACCALPGVEARDHDSRPFTHRVTVPAADAPAFEDCIGKVLGLYVPELRAAQSSTSVEWTGARICEVMATETCRQLGADQAQVVDAVLLAAEPAPPDAAYCAALGPLYRIVFEHPTVKPVPVEVPSVCGPMRRGAQEFLLAGPDRAAVEAAFDSAESLGIPSTGGASVVLSAEQQKLIDSCVGRENALPAPGWVGTVEADVAQKQASSEHPVRVVARNGTCAGRDDDRREDRVNLVLDDGRVIWAGRF